MKTKLRVVPELMMKLEMLERKLSHSEVAENLKVYRETVTQTVNGKRKLTIDEMVSFCEMIGITPNEFLGIEVKNG